MLHSLFVLLSDVVYASNAYITGSATEDFDCACAAIHIEVVVGEKNICTALNFNTACIAFCADGDFIAANNSAELGINEAEVLGSAEHNASGAYLAAGLIYKTVGVIAIISIIMREVLLGQPYCAESRAVNIKAAAFDDRCIGAAQRPFRFALEVLEGLVADIEVSALFESEGFGIEVGVLRKNSFLMAGDENGSEETLLIVVQCLPATEVVKACPACNRPAVIELPYNCTHAATTVAAPVLNTVLHCLSLEQLRCIYKVVNLAGIEIHLGEVVYDSAVCGGVALVLFHNVGEDVSVFRLGKAVYGFHAGEGLEAKLGYIAEEMIAVIGEGEKTMPYHPVVNVTAVGVLREIEAAAAGRACGPVEGLGIFFLEYLGNYVFVHFDVVGLLAVSGNPFALVDKVFHLVIAAP